MRLLLFISFVFVYEITFAQREETLYYYLINDSVFGVKNKKGKIIIPPAHRYNPDINTGDTVPGGLISFFEYPAKPNQRGGWKTYDRNGKFLFQPYTYEFEPDRIYEGLSRFTENGKIGFVDRQGKKIIPAQFDYVNWFSLGVASFCNGCYFDPSNDPEHPRLAGGTWGFVNRQGKILVDNFPFDRDELERVFDSLRQTFYIKEFQYNSFEKKLIQKLEPYKSAIEKIFFSKYTDDISASLIFDIVEKPTQEFPYYVIESREKIGNKISINFWDKLQFLFNETGQIVYASYIYDDFMPFEEWYSQYMKRTSQ